MSKARRKGNYRKALRQYSIASGIVANKIIFNEYVNRARATEELIPDIYPHVRNKRKHMIETYKTLLSSVPPDRNILIKDSQHSVIRLFYSSDKAFFIKYDKTMETFQKSILYVSVKRATEVYRENEVLWSKITFPEYTDWP